MTQSRHNPTWKTFIVAVGFALTTGCASQTQVYADVAVVSNPGHRSRSNASLIERAGDAVAVVETPSGRGLGFVVDPRGYLITNRHVVEDAAHIESISFPAHDPPQQYRSVRVVYIDPERDLALLHVHTPQHLPRLPLASRKALPAGRYLQESDPVVLLEFRPGASGPALAPEDPSFVAHNASVTSLGVVNPAAGPGAFVGLDADVKRGQSGGPVLDRAGRVVGIVTWTWRDQVGGFAIPIGDVMRMLEERPALDSNDQHRVRIAQRSRQFLAALGRGDVEDARRFTSPSHAREIRSEAVGKITAQFEGHGAPVIEGFFAAVESLVGHEDEFARLRVAVTRTASAEFRRALALPADLDDAQVISFFFELGQAYLIARSAGGMGPEEALGTALRRLQTVDAARTFAIADALTELAGSEVQVGHVEVVPGAYTPTAVVSLARSAGDFEGAGGRARGTKLTLHMRLEWGDWYVASVSPTPLSDRSR